MDMSFMDKNILEATIKDELAKINFISNPYSFTFIREKFGISVFRIIHNEKSYVGKYFNNTQIRGRKEIKYYSLLESIGVPTIKMVAHTDCLILMEDLEKDSNYRHGKESDLTDPTIVRNIAKWFKLLHTNSRSYSRLDELGYFSYSKRELTTENITNVMEKSNYDDNELWNLLFNNLELLTKTFYRLCNTIIYTDFYWDNLAVALDNSSAVMFDYNCMNRGYAYADIRHTG